MVLLTMILNNVDRTMISIVAEQVKAEFALSDTEWGTLMGFAFTSVYMLLVLPLGRYADTVGVRRDIIAGSLALWSLFTLATGWVTSYVQLFLMRMGVGVGEAGATAPSISMLSDYLRPERRARGLSVVSMGAVIGMGFGMMVGGWISENLSWRTAFVAAGAPGVALAVVFRLTVREPARGGSEGRRSGEAGAFLPSLKALLATRTYLIILSANAFTLFASMGRNLWEPAFLMRTYEMGEFRAATWYFLTSPLPSMLGIFLGGLLADRLGQRDRRWFLWVPAFGLIASPPILVAFLLWPKGDVIVMPAALSGTLFDAMPVALVWSVAGSVIGGFFTAPFMSTTQGVVPLRMRAFAAAISTLLSAIIGLGLGPLIVGLLSDALAPTYGVDALRYALLAPTMLPILSGVICLAGASRVARDLERSHALDA
ncbi:MAG: MFS transporter [Myxococcota bacterium]